MNQALLKEKVIFDLWSKKPISSSDPHVLGTLVGLHSKGHISSMESPALTDEGLEYILHGRGPSELVELLSDLNVSEDERIFLANAIKGMVDKPFVYEIIKTAAGNPDREKYPSVDLGAYDDIGHGMLFGANTHIMIDPLIGKRTIDYVLQKLKDFGVVITEDQRKGYGAHVWYNIGNREKELYIVWTEAMKIDRNLLRRRIEPGIFALMMKGRGGDKDDGYGNLLDAVEHYNQFLVEGGILLTGVPLKEPLEKIGEGMLDYYIHRNKRQELSPHKLYLKPVKG